LFQNNVEKLTVAIEAIFELMFPFSPMNYRVISNLPVDMHVFLGLPCPFVIGCSTQVFQNIERICMRDYRKELMILDIDNERMNWDRQVNYPQPHTQYFFNSLQVINQTMVHSK